MIAFSPPDSQSSHPNPRETVVLGAPAANRHLVAFLAILILYFGGWLGMWISGDHARYARLMHFIGVRPTDRPFFDLEGVLSWGDCQRRGLDVLVTNPCDSQHRPFNYSPFLLDFPLRWLGTRHTVIAGLLMDASFLLMVPIVLRPRTRGELGIFTAASLSTATVYALERANLDVLEFVLITVAGLPPQHRQWSRFAAYAAYLAGGLIKFYPFALLIMMVRERPRLFGWLCGATMLLIGAYTVRYWSDLVRIPPLLPRFQYFDDTFGARHLPFGVMARLGLSFPAGIAVLVGLTACSILVAIRIATRLVRAIDTSAWSLRRIHYLTVASIVLVACFFLQDNAYYRGIFLLLALPGFLELRGATSGRLKLMFTAAIALSLFCLWEEFFRMMLGRVLESFSPGYTTASWWDVPNVLFYLAREFAWWFVISVCGAIIIGFLLQSPLARVLARRVAVHFPAAARGTV